MLALLESAQAQAGYLAKLERELAKNKDFLAKVKFFIARGVANAY